MHPDANKPVPPDHEWYWPGAYFGEHGQIKYRGYPTLCPKGKHTLDYPWSTCRHKKKADALD